jgi:RNA polymerase sigma-70 factor (ECF subfamily)
VGEPPLSDDLLIARIAAGDREAFAELYRRHRADVCRFAAHMCGSITAAEDIVHEAFVAVIGSASRYRPGQTTAKLWLLGIVRNHARRARAVRRTLSLHDEAQADAAKLTVEVDPVGDLDRRRHLEALRRAVVALPVRYREASCCAIFMNSATRTQQRRSDARSAQCVRVSIAAARCCRGVSAIGRRRGRALSRR